jgi:predicted Zn-dependent hydrolases of the beta-lactamase fold
MKYLNNIELLCHSSIRLNRKKKIYFDPYKIKQEYHAADFVFCTHEHYDHFSPQDIKKVITDKTIIVTVPKTKKEALTLQPDETRIITVKPNEDYKIAGLEFITLPAYNINKLFHPKQKEWVGYMVRVDGIRYYIAGDTDFIPELESIQCDVAFVPVGGMYTMNYKQAAELINTIKPKVAIPTHYGTVIGDKIDAEEFQKLVSPEIETEIIMNEEE